MKVAARNSCLEDEFNMWDPGKWTSCYTGWLAPILAALFVFLTNLVLFTYIIGVVSHYNIKVKDRSEKIWTTQVYKLIDWSTHLPLPPPPLNLIWFALRMLITLILLVYLAVLWIVRKRNQYDDPEEFMLNYPKCFTVYLHVLWVLSWFYKTRRSNYTKSVSNRSQVMDKAMLGLDSMGVENSSSRVHTDTTVLKV